jgi:hypothetical protein
MFNSFGQNAELLQRVASIPTHGDRLIDRDLLVLAYQLEEEAGVREEYLKTHSMFSGSRGQSRPATGGLATFAEAKVGGETLHVSGHSYAREQAMRVDAAARSGGGAIVRD